MNISHTALLTTHRAAEQLRVSASFLNKARLSGDGPIFVKIGRAVRYEQSAIDDFLAGQRRSSTSQLSRVVVSTGDRHLVRRHRK